MAQKMSNERIDSSYEDAVKYFRAKCMDVVYMREMVNKLEKEGRMDKIVTMTEKYLCRGGIQEHELERLPVIHIAGSKGKGSTTALTESILRHHGYKTGMFVSPHLYQIRERICINGRPLSKEKFCLYFWEVFKKIENTVTEGPIEDGGQITGFFDTLLVMAFRAFISEGVDVVVLEVGKGGKTDRTNFVHNPVVCGITPLALEHTRTLGSTIDKIAWHKAGIIKPGRPVITVAQKPEAMQVILDTAKANNSPVYIAEAMPSSLLTQYEFKLGLTGNVQLQNAGLAVHLFQAWKSWKGLANCRTNGRTQVVRSKNVTYYLDTAPTEDSAKNLVSWFKKEADQEVASVSGKVARVLVFACIDEKDHVRVFNLLKDLNFDGAAFPLKKLSDDEPLWQHSDEKHKVSINNQAHQENIDHARLLKADWDEIIGSPCTNGNDTTANAKTHMFECELQALVWATQGKDPELAACMAAPRELLPPAPAVMRDADHIQVLVTGSNVAVGIALSLLVPNMND